MADLTHGKPKAPNYNPYSNPQQPQVKAPVVRQPPTRYSRRPAYTAPQNSCSRRLDKTTRSRNALIIAVVVFLVLFLVCLALVIIYIPKLLASSSATGKQTSISFQITSVMKNASYDATLNDPASYPAVLLNTTLCGYANDAIKSLTTVQSCNAIEFSDAAPGVKSTMNLTASLTGKTPELADATEDAMFAALSTAIVTGAGNDPNWEVTSTDIKLIPWVASLASSVVAQMPLLLCLLFVLQTMF